MAKNLKSFAALIMALLLCLSFASCKKANKDKTSSDATNTSSYNFVLEDDADEPLTSEEEEAVASAWNSFVNESDSVVFEPYKPSGSSVTSDSSSSSVPASSTEASSSSEVSSTTTSDGDSSSDTPTSSEIPVYPGVH